jgi:hypothetical protein
VVSTSKVEPALLDPSDVAIVEAVEAVDAIDESVALSVGAPPPAQPFRTMSDNEVPTHPTINLDILPPNIADAALPARHRQRRSTDLVCRAMIRIGARARS